MASENVAELLHRNTRLRSQVLHRIAEIDAQLQHIDCLLKAVGDQPSTHIKYVLRSSPPSPSSASSSPRCSITTSASLMAVASAGRVNRRIADPFRDAGLCAGVGHHILQREPIPLSRAAMDMIAREAVFPAMANTSVAGKGHSYTYRGVVRESKRQREPVTKKKLLQRFVAAMSFPKCVGHWADPFSHTVVALCFMLESMLLPCVRHEERVGRLREVFLLPRVQRLQESVVEPRMLAHVVQCKDADLLKNTRVEQLRRMQWRPREEIQDEVVMEVFYALIIASGCGAGPAYNKGEVRLLFGP